MKVSLAVLVPGKTDGKTVPIAGPKFLIGRDEGCQLRPASPMVSKRHCLLRVRDNKVFVQDLGSTNGTFVNDRQVPGEIQVANQDRLTIGPLNFAVCIENDISAAPAKVPAIARANLEDSAADMLLAMSDEAGKTTAVENACTDSTMMDMPLPPDGGQRSSEPAAAAEKKKAAAKPAPTGNTSAAAKELLDKYLRRPR